jgi:hypothetical protein
MGSAGVLIGIFLENQYFEEIAARKMKHEL